MGGGGKTLAPTPVPRGAWVVGLDRGGEEEVRLGLSARSSHSAPRETPSGMTIGKGSSFDKGRGEGGTALVLRLKASNLLPFPSV